MKTKMQKYFMRKNIASLVGGIVVAQVITNETGSTKKGAICGTVAGIGFSLIGGAILMKKQDQIMEADGFTKVEDGKYEKIIKVNLKE